MKSNEVTNNQPISHLMDLSRNLAREEPDADSSLRELLILQLGHFFLALMPRISLEEAYSLAGLCVFRIVAEQHTRDHQKVEG